MPPKITAKATKQTIDEREERSTNLLKLREER
jgi:hypothetical protein